MAIKLASSLLALNIPSNKLLKTDANGNITEAVAGTDYLVTVPSHTHDASNITSGTFSTSRIPNLAASKITSGTFADARISSSSVTQHEADLTIHTLSGSTNDVITINSTLQVEQGSEDAIISFEQDSVEIGKFDQDGYLHATGFKASGTTGFLKSDGSIDTSTYASSSHNHNSLYVAIAGGYYDSDFTWDGTHDFQNVIKVSGASATTTNTTALFYGTGGLVEKRTLGTAAFSATGDFATAAQGALADSALQSLPSHTHDTRYYTKSQSDAKYLTKGDSFIPISMTASDYEASAEEVVLVSAGSYKGLAFPNGAKDFEFEVSIKGSNGANHQGIFWGATDLTSLIGAGLTGYKTTHQNADNLHIRDIANNSNQMTINPEFAPDDGQYHRYRLVQYRNSETDSAILKVYLDGNLIFNTNHGGFNNPPQQPTYFGFIVHTGDVKYAHWNVRDITDSEDLIRTIGEDVFQPIGNYLTSLPAHNHDARYYTETEMDGFLSGKLSTSGGSLSGALNVLYNDHANGTGWDKNLFIGTSDDLGLAGAFPTYVPSGSYGFFSHANSDGVFIGSVPTTAGSSNYYATIAWGDDATEYFQFLYKGSQVARLDTVGRFYAYGGNSEEWNAAYSWGNHAGLYLGATAKAADSNLLDGIDSTGFVKQLSDGSSPNYQTPSSRRVNPNADNPTNEHYAVTTFGNSGNVTGQLATHFQTGQLYSRGYNSSWSAWKKYATEDYAAAAAQAVQTNLEGLESGLGSAAAANTTDFAPASHVHDYLRDSHLVGQSTQDANDADSRGVTVRYLGTGASNKPSGVDHSLLTLSYSESWSTQLAGDWRTKQLYFRTQENGTWKSWATIYHSDNLNIGTLDGYTQNEVDTLIDTAIDGLVASAPGTLDTLNELAAALGDDANFSTTVTNSIATKVPLSGSASISGMKTFTTSLTNNDDWQNSPISILERDAVGNTETDNKYAPNLNFHWASRVSNSLWMNYTGTLHYGSYSGTGVPASDGTFKAGTLYAGSGQITSTKVGNWDTAFGWGNHAGLYDAAGTGASEAQAVQDNLDSLAGSLGSLALEDSVTWSEVTGKPSTFTPSAHTHSAADITSGTLAGARLPWNDNDGFNGTYPIVWTATDGLYRSSWLQVRGSDDTLLTRNIDAAGYLKINGGTFVDNARGSIRLNSSNVGAGNGIFFRDGFTYNASITVEDHNGSYPDGICISGYDGISFSTGSNDKNERMRITTAGKVGIGTTNPTTIFHAVGALNDGWGIFQRGTKQLYVNPNYSGTNVFAQLAPRNGDSMDLSLAGNDSRTDDIYIKHDTGNVGINTTNPTTKLYVDGGESTFNRGNSDGAIARFRGKNNEKAVIGTVDSWFGSRVGIGTSSPTTQLQVGATSTNSISPVASLGSAYAGILSALSLVNTTGNAAAGYGVAMDFHVNSGYSPTGRIATIAENTSTPAALAFYTYNGGLNKKMQISSDGSIRFHAYGAGLLKTDANGNVSLDTSTYATATDLQALETYANATFLQSVPSTFSATAITLSGIKLEESSDRPGILEINRDGSNAYAGIMTKFSGTAEWALMGDEGAFGLYDDQNNDWAWRYIENSELSLYHNGSAKIVTKSDGANVVGRLYATGAIQVPYAAGEHKPMIVLAGATTYGLFHTEATNDEFTFDFNGTQKFKFSQDGILTVNGNTVTTGKITNWDTAYGWGNHASAGYALASTLGSLALEDSVTISEVTGLQTALDGKLSTSGGTLTGTLRLPWLWSSTDLTANSFYVQRNSTEDGFAFGIGTGVSTWFSWDGGAPKRAIDVWNNGSIILLGAGGHDTEIQNNLYVPNHIFHTGDTDTYMQFHAANQWRVVTGGAERLEVNDTEVTVQNDFKVFGSYTEVGNGIGSVSNDGGWNGRLNVAGTQHARLDVISVSDGIVTTTYSHTGQGMGKMGTISNHPLGLMTAGGHKVMLGTGGNMYPVTDRTQLLGLETNRWQVVFCEILDSAGLHEKNLQNPEGEKSVGDYATGTVLVWKGGKNVPCTESADHMRMGIAVKGVSSPLVQGAEPVLCTGEVNEGDYLVTSSVEGHAAAISPQYMRQHNLFDCVLGKALEEGNGDSHIIKTWVNI